MSNIGNLGATIGKSILVSKLRSEGTKKCNQDSNDSGKDDLGGKSLLAMADAIESIEFTDNPIAIRNIGIVLEAVGKRLQELKP